jgi:aspartyl aminopeptidase
MQLNTEGYGGMLCATWFDRPLSVAGRIVVREGERLVTKLLDMERDLLMIPSLAIHMNRKANEGVALNGQVDMLPLFGGADTEKGDFKRLIAEQAGVAPQAIYGSDLYLYNRMAPSLWGAKEEFLSAPRLDDLQCAYATLEGFRRAKHPGGVNVYACFDNEEVGSGTKQGAASTFLADVLMRLNAALGRPQEDYYRAVADSFMVSADNAHAVHPNHPEKTDPENCVYMNEGIVIKSHAGQKYTSDAVSAARFRMICERADVPVQFFSNRSDAAGGSTLGNIAMGQVSMDCVDIGLPQLAMHSAYETAGVKDTEYLIRAMEEFFSA